jgi:hypothetical protein
METEDVATQKFMARLRSGEAFPVGECLVCGKKTRSTMYNGADRVFCCAADESTDCREVMRRRREQNLG